MYKLINLMTRRMVCEFKSEDEAIKAGEAMQPKKGYIPYKVLNEEGEEVYARRSTSFTGFDS